jgi:hypothetical protein
MTQTKSRFSIAIGMAMLAGMVMLSACGGPEPMRTPPPRRHSRRGSRKAGATSDTPPALGAGGVALRSVRTAGSPRRAPTAGSGP